MKSFTKTLLTFVALVVALPGAFLAAVWWQRFFQDPGSSLLVAAILASVPVVAAACMLAWVRRSGSNASELAPELGEDVWDRISTEEQLLEEADAGSESEADAWVVHQDMVREARRRGASIEEARRRTRKILERLGDDEVDLEDAEVRIRENREHTVWLCFWVSALVIGFACAAVVALADVDRLKPLVRPPWLYVTAPLASVYGLLLFVLTLRAGLRAWRRRGEYYGSRGGRSPVAAIGELLAGAMPKGRFLHAASPDLLPLWLCLAAILTAAVFLVLWVIRGEASATTLKWALGIAWGGLIALGILWFLGVALLTPRAAIEKDAQLRRLLARLGINSVAALRFFGVLFLLAMALAAAILWVQLRQ